MQSYHIFTSDKGGGICFCPCLFVCLSGSLSVCLWARLLKNACMDLDEMWHVDRCRDIDELINFWARSGEWSRSRNRIYTGFLHFSGISEEVMGGFRWIWMKCCVSTDVGTWTNWLTFEPDPDHSPDPGTRFTPDFWILAGYMKKLWADFDIFCASICMIWLGFEVIQIIVWILEPDLHWIFGQRSSTTKTHINWVVK